MVEVVERKEMSTRKRTSLMWEFFELREVAIKGEKLKKADCKLCDGVNLAYGGGTSNLLHHLEVKHPVSYKKAFPGDSCTTSKQATLSAFIKTFPPEQLLCYIDPGYKLPLHPHLTATCRRLFSSLKEDLIEVLALRHVAITTDLWTSRAIESYITVTAHFVSKEWVLENKVC